MVRYFISLFKTALLDSRPRPTSFSFAFSNHLRLVFFSRKKNGTIVYFTFQNSFAGHPTLFAVRFPSTFPSIFIFGFQISSLVTRCKFLFIFLLCLLFAFSIAKSMELAYTFHDIIFFKTPL